MPGVFNVIIKDNMVYKTIDKTHKQGKKIFDELKNDDNLQLYIKELNSHVLPIIGKFIEKPINIENNGDYTMKYVNGINLMDILKKDDPKCVKAGWNSNEVIIEKNMGINILKQLYHIENELYRYSKNNSLRGDWFLHNLIYDTSRDIIYNIDLEGFYSYYNESPMCNLDNYIYNQFNTCKQEILNQINSNVFSIILWNPVEKFFDEIENIFNEYKLKIILTKQYHINDMKSFVDNVYKLDIRCHKPYLPKKIEILQKYNPVIRFLIILIDNPNYDSNNVSKTAVNIKEKIRFDYKNKIEYYKDNIIHVSDNSLEANNIYKLIL